MKLLSLITLFTTAASLQAQVTTSVSIDSTFANVNDDVVGSGTLTDGGLSAGWSLTSTVSGTNDWANIGLTNATGSSFIQYNFQNTTGVSTDVNEIEFSVTPNAGAQVGNITLEQSPDFNGGGWNGSSSVPFSMTLSWAGGEMATLSDPNNQLNIADGTSIASGTTITANNVETLQANDSWSIELPEGVEILTVNFLSGGNTAFNVEYLSFAASLTVADTDTDGIPDSLDIDKDNDGILNVDEGSTSLFTAEFAGTFGSLPNEDSSTADPNQRDLQSPVIGYDFVTSNNAAGQYSVTNAAGADAFFPGAFFAHLVDNTTGTNEGAFLVVNGSTVQAAFFSETITLVANTDYDFGFFSANGVAAPSNESNPYEIGMRIFDSNDSLVVEIESGERTSLDWEETSSSFNTGSETQFRFEVFNISIEAAGNDFAIDAIFV